MISFPSSEQEVSSTLSPGAAQPRRCKGSRWEASLSTSKYVLAQKRSKTEAWRSCGHRSVQINQW